MPGGQYRRSLTPTGAPPRSASAPASTARPGRASGSRASRRSARAPPRGPRTAPRPSPRRRRGIRTRAGTCAGAPPRRCTACAPRRSPRRPTAAATGRRRGRPSAACALRACGAAARRARAARRGGARVPARGRRASGAAPASRPAPRRSPPRSGRRTAVRRAACGRRPTGRARRRRRAPPARLAAAPARPSARARRPPAGTGAGRAAGRRAAGGAASAASGGKGPRRAAPSSDLVRVDRRRLGGAGRLLLRPLALLGLLVAVRRVAVSGRDARRRKHHRHVAAVLLGPLLDRGQLAEVLREAVEDHLPALGVGHLAAAEHDRHLDLVARLEEALDVALLGVVVVLRDLRAELDLPHVDLRLVLARGLLLLVLLVLVLRVVEHAADRRLRLGRHLDEVEIALLRIAEGLLRLHDADLLTRLVDEPDLGHTYALVDPGGVALRRLPVEPSGDRH